MHKQPWTVCLTNEGIYERGNISPSAWYTIDMITVKMSDGKRKTRYAVCVNGRWNSKQQMTLREARAHVEDLKNQYIADMAYAMYI